MSVDATTVRYCCPFCDEDFSTERKARKHITDSDEGDHYGVNGFEMNRVIGVKEDKSRLPLHDKILEAADKFDELTYNAAEKVAEAADVSKYRVLRIWHSEDMDIKDLLSNAPIYWDGLTETTKDTLAAVYHNPELYYTDIADELDITAKTVSCTLQEKEFLLDDKYRSERLEDWGDPLADEESEDSSSSEIHERLQHMEEEKLDLIVALNEAGVDFRLEFKTEEDDFQIVKKLIKAGHEEVAEQFFNN